MSINELLLRNFMAQNPDLSFGLEESFPLKSTYANAVPIGPLMELGVQDAQNSFTRETATQAVNYWHDAAQQFLTDSEAPHSPARFTYAKMAAAQAALLADHQYGNEAEQAYRLAAQISPASPEAVYGLGQLLANTGRADEARQLVADFERAHGSLPPHRLGSSPTVQALVESQRIRKWQIKERDYYSRWRVWANLPFCRSRLHEPRIPAPDG